MYEFEQKYQLFKKFLKLSSAIARYFLRFLFKRKSILRNEDKLVFHLNLLFLKTSNSCSKTKGCVVALIFVIAVGGLSYALLRGKSTSDEPNTDRFHRHTVVSNGPECAPIGM